MYPSSSSQGSMGSSGLIRYGSAPGSFLAAAVDSVVGGANRDFSALGSQQPHLVAARPPYFSAADTSSVTSESTCKANNPSPDPNKSSTSRLQRCYGMNEIAVGGDLSTLSINLNSKSGGGGGSLVRHSSSPAGFLNHLTVTTSPPAADNGFSITRGIRSYNSKGVSDSGHKISRLNSQLSFTRGDSFSPISEESEHVGDGISTDNGHRKAAHSYATASFGKGSWDDTNAIMFSAPPSQRAKNISGDVHCLNTAESQFQFSLPQTALEIATMEKLIQIPEDSVPCKIRAKRGCATHPRSIAERERRTRISGKLKTLQVLVPNMDKGRSSILSANHRGCKQTSYADMLDLAVQHIKGLQNQIQNLNKELENCTCGCKQTT